MRLSEIPSVVRIAQLRHRVKTWRVRLDRWRRGIGPEERGRLRAHAFALALVAAAAILQSAVAVPMSELRFWLFHAAIATAAATGGAQAAAVAALASFLAARVMAGVTPAAGLLFLAEGMVIAYVVHRLRTSVRQERRRMAVLEAWAIELKSNERQSRLIDAALTRLDAIAPETALLLLDSDGRISGWRAGASRVYGHSAADMLRTSPSSLFENLTEAEFARLITDARQGAAHHAGRHRRADGSTFDAEVEIQSLPRGGGDGFTMIVRDLTRDQAGEAAARSTATAYAQLRHEAEVAREQLSTLHHVTDPSLNSLTGGEFLTTLLDRLRGSINAEGVALVHIGRFRRKTFCASEGLQCERGVRRPAVELGGADAGRTLMIHNDPAGVAELSAAGWPEGVSSMMAVPVVRTGTVQAVLEVVHHSGRRATEWEIALVQVVAGRIAGFLEDDPYADTGAVA
jgi:PAS domain S-box-containing protein